MNYRLLGRTGWNVSEVSFGAWAIGGTWGQVDDKDSLAALQRAIELGVNFIDTADVYGDGRSERLVAQAVRSHPGTQIYVATKFGRRLDPHTAEGYSAENLEGFLDRSLQNLGVDAVDLVQLHCPPTSVYESDAVFEVCENLAAKGKLRHYGVSVEKIDEAIKATEYPGVQSVQIIYNMFRPRPAESFFPLARERKVGILARLPLSSGMLSGKMKSNTAFEPEDHRAGNREGQWFDKGETFSGVPYEVGLAAVEELKVAFAKRLDKETLAQIALKWILMNEAVTCVIPGAKRARQAEENALASGLAPLDGLSMETVQEIYNRLIRPHVHHLW